MYSKNKFENEKKQILKEFKNKSIIQNCRGQNQDFKLRKKYGWFWKK